MNSLKYEYALQWRYNGLDGVSNHQPHHCLFNCLFGRRSKKTSKFRVTGFVRGIHRWPVNSPHKGPSTRKMFPFDDVIMVCVIFSLTPGRFICHANIWDSAQWWLNYVTHMMINHLDVLQITDETFYPYLAEPPYMTRYFSSKCSQKTSSRASNKS